MRGGLFAILTWVVAGAIVGDFLAHPAGTQAAGNALSSLLKTSLQGASGQAVK